MQAGLVNRSIRPGLLLVAMLCVCCCGLDNYEAHPGLSKAAVELTGIDELKARISFNPAIHPSCSFIDEGSVKEDLIMTPGSSWDTGVWGGNACGIAALSSQNHSYNPTTGAGWSNGIGTPTLDYIPPLWNAAVQNYQQGAYDAAYFQFGRICHLIQDMTAPAHVHGDVHIDGDDFESWGQSHFHEYDFAAMGLQPYTPTGTVTLYNGTEVPARSILGMLHGIAAESYALSAFQGHLIEIHGSQPDSELSRMFPSLHFYDAGIIGDDYWEMDNIGDFETIWPSGDEWWPCEGDSYEYHDGYGTRHIEGLFYIENSGGHDGNLTPAVFEKPGMYEAAPNTTPLMRIYGDVLFPKAVTYGAGVLLSLVSPRGDFDFDRNVDLADFSAFAAHWLRTDCDLSNNWCGRMDIDTDTSIGTSDLALLAEAWLSGD